MACRSRGSAGGGAWGGAGPPAEHESKGVGGNRTAMISDTKTYVGEPAQQGKCESTINSIK